MHTRMHGLASAVDGVTTSISDTALIRTDTQRALGFGLTANLCIHPKQVPVIHAALAPSQDALEWAGRVIVVDRAASGSAVQLDGCMVDMPVVMQARRMLARAFG